MGQDFVIHHARDSHIIPINYPISGRLTANILHTARNRLLAPSAPYQCGKDCKNYNWPVRYSQNIDFQKYNFFPLLYKFCKEFIAVRVAIADTVILGWHRPLVEVPACGSWSWQIGEHAMRGSARR